MLSLPPIGETERLDPLTGNSKIYALEWPDLELPSKVSQANDNNRDANTYLRFRITIVDGSRR